MKDTGPKTMSETPSVGERLAEARNRLGLELEDIAERTRIPVRHLVAIETSTWDSLPATTYAAGFVKTYARIVDLDPEALSSEFRAERGETPGINIEYTPFEPADPSRVPPRLLAMIGLGAAVAFALLYLVWRGVGGYEERASIAAGTVPQPEAAAPAKPAPRPRPLPPAPAPLSDSTPVVLTATDQVWLKVSEKDGETLFMGQLEPGQSYTVPATAKDPRLLTGRPQSLRATIGDRTLATLGDPKTTIRDVSLKGPALIARDAALPKVPVEPAPRPVAIPPAEPSENVASAPTP